ncbi:MAG: protease modulator HflC [Kiloniellales bacterium]
MSRRLLLALGIVVIAAGVLAYSTLFTVHQTQQALVLQFGEWKRTIQEPGLHWKLPFIQNVEYYERRVLDLDPPKAQVQLTDKKRINVDAYVRYKIVDPLTFYQSVRTETAFRDRFGRIVEAGLRAEVAKVSLSELLSEKRIDIMHAVRTDVDEKAKDFGIELVDVRIGRTDLPEETSQAVYNRMRSERERQARELRAEGGEEALKIRARADREKVVLVAEAERQSRILKGEGDGERNRILGDAYGRDPEFFAFYKSMEQYREALAAGDTTMVLSPNSDFFRFFGSLTGRPPGEGGTGGSD